MQCTSFREGPVVEAAPALKNLGYYERGEGGREVVGHVIQVGVDLL